MGNQLRAMFLLPRSSPSISCWLAFIVMTASCYNGPGAPAVGEGSDSVAEETEGGDAGEPETTGETEGSDESGGTGPAAPAEDPEDAETGLVELDGEQLFLQTCAGCHGADALGTPSAYELRHPVREYARAIVRQGRSGPEFPDSSMPAFSVDALSDESLDEILEYLDSFPQPISGEELYTDYCRNCHGADAQNGACGKSLAGELDELGEKVRDGNATTSFTARHEYMPQYEFDRLDNAEVEAIEAYLRTIVP